MTKNARKRSLSKWRRDIAPGHIEVRRHATNIHQPYARRRKANVDGSRGQGRKLRHPLLRRRSRCRWSLSGLPTPGRRAHRQHRPRHRRATARIFDKTTSDLATLAQSGKPLFGIQESNAGKVVIFGSGVPVVLDGTIVGAVGASAGAVEQGIAVAEAAIAALGHQARSSDDLNRKTTP